MNSSPLVSIVIPALDPQSFTRALNSAVAQLYPRLEVLVCDDSQGVDVLQAVHAVQARLPANVQLQYVANAQALGLNATLSEGVRLAKGEFIKVLFDEDWLMPEHVALLANVLIRHSDISIAASQRLLSDPSNRIMPNRMENSGFAPGDTRFKGSDLLSMFEVWPVNFIGPLSCVLLRRADVRRLMPALTDSNAPFEVLLDMMLYSCLLCQGDLGIVDRYLAVERLKPLRLSAFEDLQAARENELEGLLGFLAGRDGERAEQVGGVRYCSLDAMKPQWEEMGLGRIFGVQADTMFDHVGVDCDDYDGVYEQWLKCRDFTLLQLRQLPERVEGWSRQAKIVPVILDRADAAGLQASLASLAAQSWSAEAIVVLSSTATQPSVVGNVLTLPLEADWPVQINRVLRELDGFDWFCLLRAGDELSPHALLLLAERIADRETMQACYWDEDALEPEGYRSPVFRPDFNLDLMRSYPYVGRGLAFSRQIFLDQQEFSPGLLELAPHDLLLRLVERCDGRVIEHIAEVLLHARQSFSAWLGEPSVRNGNAAMVAAHLNRLGVDFDIGSTDIRLINRIRYRHTGQPLVSIVIPCQADLQVLHLCLCSLVERTANTHFEVLVVTSAVEWSRKTVALQAEVNRFGARLRVVEMPAGSNLSTMFNEGARHACGEYLLTLSPHCMAQDDTWLDEMLSHARRNEVGIVGARLQGTDGRIEHAGLVLGLRGAAGSVFATEPATTAGYLHRLQVVQNYSAVSQHCLLIEKVLFDELGGFAEGDLAHGFADVDLCLRAGEKGYLVVWTPYASLTLNRSGLVQDNSAPDRKQDAQRAMFARWLPTLSRDPAYNKNLSLTGSGFTMNVGLRHGWQPFARHTLPHILGLPINKGAVGHYRMIQPLAELERAGQASGMIHFGAPSIFEIERMQPDTIIFQGRYSEGPVEGIAQVKNLFTAFRIFEIDDYLLDVPEQNEHRRYMSRNIGQTLGRGVALCDRLVVSTESLADAMSGMHSDIVVVPNMLAPQRWANLSGQRAVGKKPRVGWGGGTSHTGDLLLIKEVIKALANEVEWVFLGMCPDELRPFVHEYHAPVPLDLYPRKMSSLNLDLAIAPLEQHIFNDCKSNLRLLEYGACGFPVVCTETRSYRGQLPVSLVKTNSSQEWLDAIRTHLAEPDASAQMGRDLQAAVREKFMLHGPALQRWLDAWTPG